MQFWRISNYANLLGERGLRYGARWHTAGHRIVYLAASPAGALLEVIVHLELREDDLPPGYQLLEVTAPKDIPAETLDPQSLPHSAEWELDLAGTRSLGDEWLRSSRTALAKVPSALLPQTWNYLLNPDHPHAAAFTIQNTIRALYDPRLLPTLRR